MAVYLVMFPSGVAVMARMVREGPVELPEQPVEGLQHQAALKTPGE